MINEDLKKEMTIITKVVIAVMATSLSAAVIWSVTQLYSVSEIKTEMRYMNQNISTLNITAKETNVQLRAFTKHHAENLAILTKSIVVNKYDIENLEENCKENKTSIHKCEQYHLDSLMKD